MAISKGRLNSRLHVVTLKFADTDEDLNLWFRPEYMNQEVKDHLDRVNRLKEVRDAKRQKDRLQAIAAGEEPIEYEDDDLDRAGYDLIMKLLVKWDLLESDPTPENPHPAMTPITLEELRALGIPIGNRIVAEMWASVNANPTISTNTGNSFAPTELRVVSRNGSAS